MAKTIEQLKREIAEQRKRIDKESTTSKLIGERQKLSRQLFQLRNRKLIGARAKAKRLSKRFGKGILKIGKKIAPVIQRQARLIRDQQLRDDKIMLARKKRAPKRRRKVPKKAKKSSQASNLFQPLDF